MDKPPLTDITIRKTAQALREEAVNRLNEGTAPPSCSINYSTPKTLAHRLQSKRSEALITCIVLTSVLGLSALFHPVDWRLTIGCLSAGIVMTLAGLLDRKGHSDFAMVVFLVAMGLAVLSVAKFGTKGVMLWIQSAPLICIGAFGTVYVLFEKFNFKEWDFMSRSG